MSKAGKAVQATALNVRLLVGAGKAAPAPPVGPALGQRGVKAVDFCKQFNDRTKHFTPGIPIPAKVIIQPDRSFTFSIRAPPTSWLLLRAAGVEKGSSRAGDVMVGTVSLKHIYEIAKIKKDDEGLVDLDMKALCSRIIGQARSMGIKVVP
ncbi:hypothetical protein HK102_005107 [Quaeritorhiza haematococci]|nr:hypothetical protein HK102_005107 [Quaeritorhiza haematococci]